MKTSAEPKKYRTSEKRNMTRQQNRAAIEKAAWEVFCTIGLDAANIRDIVNRSGVSPGTFYNYFGTKEAIFEVLSEELMQRLRTEIRQARAGAATVEDLLALGFEAYLHQLRSIDGAMDFIDRNRRHIRSQVYPSPVMSGLIADLARDLRRFIPPSAMSHRDRMLVSSIIIATGAEAVFQAGRKRRTGTRHLSEFLTRFTTRGLAGWQAGGSDLGVISKTGRRTTTREPRPGIPLA